jgi:1,4-alpha-glucan branching enzyme
MTMDMTPPLVSILIDPLLRKRYDKHLARLQELLENEIIRNEHNSHLRYLAGYYAR